LAEVARDPFFNTFAATLVEDLSILTDELVRRVLAEDLFYGELGHPSVEPLRADIEATLGHIIRGFAGLEPVDFDGARVVARRAAMNGVPVAAILHVYTIGAQVIWDHVVRDPRWREKDFVLDVGSVVFWLTNAYSEAISQVYDDTAAERFRRFERERTLLLDALFEGRTQDLPRLAEVARILDLPEHGELVVVTAENRSATTEGLPEFEQLLRLEGIRSAWWLRSQRHMGIVVVRPALAGHTLDTVRQLVEARATARVGISPVYRDLADTASHAALADLALACLVPGTVGVALYDDHPIGTLVARAPELGDRIVHSVLGPVLAADDHKLLVETLDAWIAEGGSTTRVANRLFCHRNTVRNRLQRVEALTGRSLDDPTAVAEICLAMTSLTLADHAEGVDSAEG
jgi:DNA-binding PucR family transcriptional regulator